MAQAAPVDRERTVGIRVAVAAAVCLAVAPGVGGCGWFEDSRPELSNDIIVGNWSASDGGELSFSKDATFRASDIPISAIGPLSTSATVSASGEWELIADVNDPSEKVTQVRLTFEELDEFERGYTVDLRSDEVDGSVVLFWSIGDPDLGRRYILEKDQ